MARCEQGYLCRICGDEVEDITQSALYLQYILGRLPAEALPGSPEQHVRCDAVTAQFIVDPDFEPVVVEGAFDKRRLDPDYVREQEALFTRGWRRLQEVAQTPPSTLAEYPLPELRRKG